MNYEKTDLCQLGWLSCMGCCGHKFGDKHSVAKGIEKNTLEYHSFRRTGKSHKDFMLRSKELRDSGVCRNLVYDTERDRIFCPLHPEENTGKDIRDEHRHCDVLHLCKTAFLFNLWDKETKTEFLHFLRKKKQGKELDWHSYSMKMVDDSLLDEFEGMDWNRTADEKLSD
jgi:hypothetical protein